MKDRGSRQISLPQEWGKVRAKPRRMRLRHCTHKMASRRIVPADSATSSVACGSHQRCKAPCKVASDRYSPHSWGRLTMCFRRFFVSAINHNFRLFRTFVLHEKRDFCRIIHFARILRGLETKIVQKNQGKFHENSCKMGQDMI